MNIYIRTASEASVTAVSHPKTISHDKAAVPDGAGQATLAYYISGARPATRITVDVTVSAGSPTANCSTPFTPVS